jgi:hypothetical protein
VTRAESTLTSRDGPSASTAFNVVEYKETKSGRSLHARFTNAAVDSLSLPLGAVMTGRTDAVPVRHWRDDPSQYGQTFNEEPAPPGDIKDIVETQGTIITNKSKQLAAGDDRDRLARLFQADGDQLRLQETRIKADSKIDFVGRLTCLFLYAHELHGRSRIPRSALTALLEDLDVNDGNARRWIASSPELMPTGDHLSLRASGRERAVKTLNRIDDSQVAETWSLGTPPRPKRSRAARRNGDAAEPSPDSGIRTPKRRASTPSKKVAGWVAAWQSLGEKANVHAILSGDSIALADKGLFGLWAIRRAVGDEGRIVPRVPLAEFILVAFEHKVDGRSLERALTKISKSTERVIHLEGTKFQITPTGIEHVEQLARRQSD